LIAARAGLAGLPGLVIRFDRDLVFQDLEARSGCGFAAAVNVNATYARTYVGADAAYVAPTGRSAKVARCGEAAAGLTAKSLEDQITIESGDEGP